MSRKIVREFCFIQIVPRESFGKRLHCSRYAKKRTFATVRYVTLRYVWVTATLEALEAVNRKKLLNKMQVCVS